MDNPPAPPDIMTPDEAAAYLRVSLPTLRKAVRRKDFPVLWIAGRWRVSRATLDAYLSGKSTQVPTRTRRKNGYGGSL